MNNGHTQSSLRRAAQIGAWSLLVLLLAACGPGPASDDAPAPPAPATDVPAESTPSNPAPPGDAPTGESPSDESPAAPTQPTPDAPPPSEPSPVAKPTSAANEPPLESMKTATPPSKLGVPVDLRYSFEGEPLANQPVTLHLAAVPRVAGANLGVTINPAAGIQVAAAGPLSVQKARVNGAYRQHFSVTRQASAPAELRVLVTMDMPEGKAFGFYGIPLESGAKSEKQDSVKER